MLTKARCPRGSPTMTCSVSIRIGLIIQARTGKGPLARDPGDDYTGPETKTRPLEELETPRAKS
jgi:hypothetical protein